MILQEQLIASGVRPPPSVSTLLSLAHALLAAVFPHAAPAARTLDATIASQAAVPAAAPATGALLQRSASTQHQRRALLAAVFPHAARAARTLDATIASQATAPQAVPAVGALLQHNASTRSYQLLALLPTPLRDCLHAPAAR